MLAIGAVMLTSYGATAQLTSLSNPEILERALQEPELAPDTPRPNLILPNRNEAPDGAQEMRFILSALSIKGVRLFQLRH